MRTAALRRVHAMLHVCATTAVAFACSSDFPDEPDRAVTLEAIDWPTELHVTDTVTVEVRLQFRDSPQAITGLRLRWISSNESVLRVVPLTPLDSGSRGDTLVAQTRAELIGKLGGVDTVRVVVEPGSGFEPAEITHVIPVNQKWTAVSAGAKHTCGITVDSVAYCWGEGINGRLGAGPNSSTKPTAVLALGAYRFVAVSAGDESTCGIIREHVAFCWGSNTDGRLGIGDATETARFIPTAVSGPAFNAIDVGRVACSLGETGAAFCWGTNIEKELGRAAGQSPALPICADGLSPGCSLVPLQLLVGPPTSYRQITVGGHHVCGLSETPESMLAFCWGTGSSGALGSASSSPTPVPVAGSFHFLAIAAGGDHTCGIATTGVTYCWGLNTSGQLGSSTSGNVATPSLITPGSFASITAGGQHTCALTSAGEALCWGLGSSGQLGTDSTIQRTPRAVSTGLVFTMLSAGESHTCGVAFDGSLYCWGAGTNGQLGTNDFLNRNRPTRVAEP